MKLSFLIAATIAIHVTGAFAEFAIDVDLAAQPIKDMRQSGCNSGIGYNSALESVFGVGKDDYWFVTNRMESARILREAGANLLRLQCFNSWFARRNPKPATPPDSKKKSKPYRQSNPKAAFDFYKANGIKVFVCLEMWSTNTVEENVRIVQWLVDNDYKGCVAGIEMGNETYASPRYPSLAPLWTAFVERAWKIWPGIKIGMNIGELFELNPDIKQMRARLMSDENIKRDWRQADAYFSAANFNRFSAQFAMGMSNCINKVSHIIYHAYGSETPYSCSYHGFKRFRNFTEMFPELKLKNKKYWLTEIRPRSDEDNWCQRMFRESLIMGHWTLMALCQPETDGFCHHQLTGLAGGLYQSDGRSWNVQWYDGTQNAIEDYGAPYNQPRMEVGAQGVVYRILGQGIRACPVFLKHGLGRETKDVEDEYTASARLTDEVYARRRALKEGKSEIPAVKGELEWVVSCDRGRNRFCVLMVNSKPTAEKLMLRISGREFTAPTYRAVSCPEKFLDCRAVPGEGRFWTQTSWEDTQSGYACVDMAMYAGMKPLADTLRIEIAPHTVQTVMFHARKIPKGQK